MPSSSKLSLRPKVSYASMRIHVIRKWRSPSLAPTLPRAASKLPTFDLQHLDTTSSLTAPSCFIAIGIPQHSTLT